MLRGAARLLDAWRAEAATARVAAAAAGRSPVQPLSRSRLSRSSPVQQAG